MNLFEYIYLQKLLHKYKDEYYIIDTDLANLYKIDVSKLRKEKIPKEFYV